MSKKIKRQIEKYYDSLDEIGSNEFSSEDEVAEYCYKSQQIIRNCREYLKVHFNLEEISADDIFDVLSKTDKLNENYTDTYDYFDQMIVVSSYGEFWIEEEDEGETAKSLEKYKTLLNEMLTEIIKL